MQPPNDAHPGEWMTIYSFATAADLDSWLTSDERAAVNAAGVDLIDGPIREQRVAALRTAPEPVTVVFSQSVSMENQDAFLALYDDVESLLGRFAGFLGSELLPPQDDVQQEHVIVASFASRHDLDRWLRSSERREWLGQVEDLVEGERTMNVVGGFGGWFPAMARRPEGPKKWKQALAVLLALYPTSLVITLIRGEVAPDMNVILAVLVANVLGVAALSFVLMPLVTRWLRPWLSR